MQRQTDMRSPDQKQGQMFGYRSLESYVAEGHPLRAIRRILDTALGELKPQLDRAYSQRGRPSIVPEQMLRALVLQLLYSVRSERRLMAELDAHMAWRWFVGLEMNDAIWDASTFSKNRERFLSAHLAKDLLQAVVREARRRRLLSEEYFTVDGTLIEAWASEKSYRPKPDPPPPGQGSGRRGELLKRDLYESRTDPDAQLYRKSKREKWRLAHLGHALTDQRHGLIVESELTGCSPKAERRAAINMIKRLMRRRGQPRAIAADRAYNERDFVEKMRRFDIEPHVPAYATGRSYVVADLAMQERIAVSQRKRRRIESCFSWLKNVAGLRKTRLRGHGRVQWLWALAAVAYNAVRMSRLGEQCL